MRNRHAKRGVTLLEILTVIGLITLLMGLGAASYFAMARSSKEEGAIAQVDVLLRQARNSAMAANSPSYIELDTANNRVIPWATRTIALWHFEEVNEYGHTFGSRHNAVLRGARQFRDGKIGKCARISAGAYIDAGADPDFDLEDGGTLEAYIRPAPDNTGSSYIFSKEGAYALYISSGGYLVGEVAGSDKKVSVKIGSKPYKIVPGRWTKVALAWDSNATRILADDLVLASGPGAKAPVTNTPLLVGHETGGLDGLVDEVRVLSCNPGRMLEFQKSMTLTHNAAPFNAVYFAGDGTLDLRFHVGPVKIEIEQDRRVRGVTVSMNGSINKVEVERKDKAIVKATPEDLERSRKETAKRVKILDDDTKAKTP